MVRTSTGSLGLEAPTSAGPSFDSHPSAKLSGEDTNWFMFSAMSHSDRSFLQPPSAGGGVRFSAFRPLGGGRSGVAPIPHEAKHPPRGVPVANETRHPLP